MGASGKRLTRKKFWKGSAPWVNVAAPRVSDAAPRAEPGHAGSATSPHGAVKALDGAASSPHGASEARHGAAQPTHGAGEARHGSRERLDGARPTPHRSEGGIRYRIGGLLVPHALLTIHRFRLILTAAVVLSRDAPGRNDSGPFPEQRARVSLPLTRTQALKESLPP